MRQSPQMVSKFYFLCRKTRADRYSLMLESYLKLYVVIYAFFHLDVNTFFRFPERAMQLV